MINKYIYFCVATSILLLGYYVLNYTKFGELFYFGCILLCIFGVLDLFKQISSGGINVVSLISSQTIVWYIYPFTYIGVFGYDKFIFDVPQINNAGTAIYVVLICGFSYFLSEKFIKKIYFRDLKFSWMGFLSSLAPLLMVQLYFFYAGARNYAAATNISGEEVGAFLLFASSLFPAVMPICVWHLASLMNEKINRKRMLIVSTLIITILFQIMWFATGGRRQMALLVFTSMVIYISVKYKEVNNARKIINSSVVAVLSAIFLWFAWESYYAIRVAYNESGIENIGITDVATARSIASNSGADDEFVSNTITRPFLTLSSLTVVRQEASGVLWGWNAGSQFLLSIPSMLFPDKFEVIGPVLENLWYKEIDVPYNDWTNTLILESYVDFGFIGFFIYLFIISFLFILILNNKIARLNKDISAVLYFAAIFNIINIEATMNSIFVGIISLAFYILVVSVINMIWGGARRAVGTG